LVDYSGANGTGQRTVYGGGKVDVSIPPCNGSAAQGRKGYSVWAPQGIVENYTRQSKAITQEWEMADDLGDNHFTSLRQGGRLPDSSLDCRTVGRVFAKNGSDIVINVFPEVSTSGLKFILLDKDCVAIDSVSGTGNLTYTTIASYDGWYTMRIKNLTNTQLGQKCWVKATYNAPEVVQTNTTKNKCACSITSTANIEELDEKLKIFPIPASSIIHVLMDEINCKWQITDLNGRIVEFGENNKSDFEIEIDHLQDGLYYFNTVQNGSLIHKKFMKSPY
jgi:alpha-amylase